jgi:DNA-binding Lrp family transcriptional regulator
MSDKSMDQLDKTILGLIQENFPLSPRPYAIIGRKAGCSEEEAYRRVTAMRKRGIIRRIGGNFDSRKLGYVGTLVGMRLADDDVDRAAQVVNKYPQVTHNYEREDSINVWFTLIAESSAKLQEILKDIKAQFPGAEIVSLPAKRAFKLKAVFETAEQ